MEQINVIELECSEAWNTVTGIYSELLEFPSPAVTLKLQAEQLEDKLTDMRAEAGRSKEAFSSSSKVINNDEKTDMIPPTTSKTEPKLVDPWRESESQCGRGRSEKFSGSSMGTRPESDYYDHKPRTSPSNPFLPRYNVPPPSPMVPIDPWSGVRFWSPFDHQQFAPPGPKLVINSFDGDPTKYLEFKRKFKHHVENVYWNNEDRMSFLEGMCTGKAKDVIAGLSCLPDQNSADQKAWSRLEKRFRDSRKLMERLQERLVNGPTIKEWDGEALTKLCDEMYKCEVSFESWGKDWMLNNQELMHCLTRSNQSLCGLAMKAVQVAPFMNYE